MRLPWTGRGGAAAFYLANTPAARYSITVQHAFADVHDAAPAPSLSVRPHEVVLIVITLPALLGAAWVGVLHHNVGRGLQAVRWASNRAEPAAPGRPVFVVGSLAGGVLWVSFALMAGVEHRMELLTSVTMWLVVLLPELAWIGGWIVLLPLLPLRREGIPGGYDEVDAGAARQHAFR